MSDLSTFMKRAGIKSNRELAKRAGINARTMDRIVADPGRARGTQLIAIGEACGMSWAEVGQILKEGTHGH